MSNGDSPSSPKRWWQRLLMYPTLFTAILGSIPTAQRIYQSWQIQVPTSQVDHALSQDELWRRNLDCLSGKTYEPVTTPSNVHILQNFLSPPVLFFFLGMAAALARSDLEIPQPVAKFFSLYLLLAIGFKGGVELNDSGLSGQVLVTMAAAMLMAVAVPIYTFFILRIRMNVYDAGAVAATYGSISAVTFITAISYLANLAIPFGGHMVAAMALMESPAIVIGVMMVIVLIGLAVVQGLR